MIYTVQGFLQRGEKIGCSLIRLVCLVKIYIGHAGVNPPEKNGQSLIEHNAHTGREAGKENDISEISAVSRFLKENA